MGITYNTSIVRSGLVLHVDAANIKSYPGSGTTWSDISGNSNNVSLVNGPTYSTANKGGFVFDGTNQYAEYSLANPYAETVIVWAKSGTTNWNKDGWISSSRRANGHIIHPNIGTKTVNFFALTSGSAATAIGGGTLSDITIPRMYAYTTNGSNSHRCYFDGTQISNSTTPISRTLTPTIQSTWVGADILGLSRFGNGTIYCTLRYDRVLSAAEIRQNFEALRGRYGV